MLNSPCVATQTFSGFELAVSFRFFPLGWWGERLASESIVERNSQREMEGTKEEG